MDVVPNDISSTSDYGSDFTPDEEEILNGLLQRLPVGSPPPVDLLLKDIENDETPLGAKFPRVHDGSGLHRASHPSFLQDQREEVNFTTWNLSDRDNIPVKGQLTKKRRDHIASKMADDGDDSATSMACL